MFIHMAHPGHGCGFSEEPLAFITVNFKLALLFQHTRLARFA